MAAGALAAPLTLCPPRLRPSWRRRVAAGLEMDVDPDKFQVWYRASVSISPSAIFETQRKVNNKMNRFVEETNRTNQQKQSNFATGRWRDINIGLPPSKLAKLAAKVKSKAQAQLADELLK